MRKLAKALAVSVAAGMLAASPLFATILKQMNLDELGVNANAIFTGTVIAVDKGSMNLGGGTIPTVSYRVVVDTSFRGTFMQKDGQEIADIRMVYGPGPTQVGDAVRFSILPKMPDIQLGQRYLFFQTRPSTAGLSTTVGLGQGLFRVTGDPGEELAVNEYDNLGLYRGMNLTDSSKTGPIDYSSLVERIQALPIRQIRR
ncbi:MAG: hypothetical protein ACREAA_16690 [Candidatus Polarisedimenticolia bacterium]